MAKTLLNVVSTCLNKARRNTGTLSSLTNSALQQDIDTFVDAINEVLADLATKGTQLTEAGEGTVTLVSGQREYDLPSDFAQFSENPVMLDETYGNQIWPYPGGYEGLRRIQTIPSKFVGLPNHYVLNPETGKIRFDNEPGSTEADRVYRFTYDKEISLSVATDTFPFGDPVISTLTPAFVQMWNRDQKQEFDAAIYNLALANAARLMTMKQARKRY